MKMEEKISILEDAFTFKGKFSLVDVECIPQYYTISDNEEFINWKEEAKEVLRSCGNYVPAQESLELIDNFRPMNELDDYKDLCAHVRVVITYLKNGNFVENNMKILDKPTVFVSYNQKSSETFVDELCEELADIATVKRDKKDIPDWGSIIGFMKTIRQQDFAILVITDDYLKSTACMYEVIELMKDESWMKKVMFAVLENTHIYRLDERTAYIEYWSNRCQEIESNARNLPLAATSDLSEELRKSTEITNNIGQFLNCVADSNNPKQHDIIGKVIERIGGNSQNE